MLGVERLDQFGSDLLVRVVVREVVVVKPAYAGEVEVDIVQLEQIAEIVVERLELLGTRPS
jgi:hypothetical protein